VDIAPVPAWRHSGSHSLVELLVLAYYFGGDDSFRETALRVARSHLDDVIPRAVKLVEESLGSKKEPVLAREIGWPLINLLALEDLTERRDEELNVRIRQEAAKLAQLIARIPPERYEGSVHSGIASEALARYHERTAEGGDYLLRFTRYWASTQWNDEEEEFQYRQGSDDTNGTWSNGINLFGIVYSADVSADPQMRHRALEVLEPLVTTTTSDGKDFAQKYRSTWRALDYMNAWRP